MQVKDFAVANPIFSKEDFDSPEVQKREETKEGDSKLSILGFVVAVVFAVTGLGILIGTGSVFNHSIPNQSNNQAPSSGVTSVRTTFVHLFEWKWTDIEKECVNYLGPKGFSAVQVSPPSEHIDHKLIEHFPWWTRYQPVSYQLESRSGTREEFISMVQTCKSVGVDIYVDAVVNHVAALPSTGTGVGVAGSFYDPTNLVYPMYSDGDFHTCDPVDIQGSDYANDPYRVRHCRLVGLPDLDQESEYVQGEVNSFMQDMVDIGVAGFRVDAAKHMTPESITSIFNKLSEMPYSFLEVIDYGGDAIKYTDYDLEVSDVTEFKYAQQISSTFVYGQLKDLQSFGPAWGFMSTLSAVVFIDNHDSQRSHAPLTFKSGGLYDIANVFMLAHPYGYPKIMSSYYFEDENFDQGPPSDEQGNTKNVYNADGSMNCFMEEWKCEHRWRPVGNMVAFRNYVSSQGAWDITRWWDNGANQIAFSRSANGVAHGYVVVNKEGYAITNQSFNTGLADGTYCDIISGDYDEETNTCSGTVVTVRDGWATFSVKSVYAAAIHGGARLS